MAEAEHFRGGMWTLISELSLDIGCCTNLVADKAIGCTVETVTDGLISHSASQLSSFLLAI